MSWSELERLVDDAELDGAIRRSLRCCRSRGELVLACRRLGYRVLMSDLRKAWHLDGAGAMAAPSLASRRTG